MSLLQGPGSSRKTYRSIEDERPPSFTHQQPESAGFNPFPADSTAYQSLSVDGEDPFHEELEPDVVHIIPEQSSRTRWTHVEDLDAFFTRVYQYHQRRGFLCMSLQEILELVQFVFVVSFSTFLLRCVDYKILFKDKPPRNGTDPTGKITIDDVLIPASECLVGLPGWLTICLSVATVFWSLRLVKTVYHVFQYYEIKQFYASALEIYDYDLDNVTWHDVQLRLRRVQREQHLCIHKSDLTELDIYNRILRFTNYEVALVNKNVFPCHFTLPFLGEWTYFTQGMKYNLELTLFLGPWAPFENPWHLRPEYKRPSARPVLTEQMSRRIFWLGIINLVLCPLIFLWQILHTFFTYAELIKRDPAQMGIRHWSLYARLYLRHFNELEHELDSRLTRAHSLSTRYISGFPTNSLLVLLSRNMAFFCGSILAVLVALTIYDEDVLTVEHILRTGTLLGGIIAVCRVFIPEENVVWSPEHLLYTIVQHVHYLPDSWRGKAHTTPVRDKFGMLFQFRVISWIEELLSPLLTPFILIFVLKPRAKQLVDFLGDFTIDLSGVGDVCSFAQLDIKKHGCSSWHLDDSIVLDQLDDFQDPREKLLAQKDRKYRQTEAGKTELSLVHFTLTNPDWRPPEASAKFLTSVMDHAQEESAASLAGQRGGVFQESLLMNSILGPSQGVDPLANPVLSPLMPLRSSFLPLMSMTGTLRSPTIVGRSGPTSLPPVKKRFGLRKVEGPLISPSLMAIQGAAGPEDREPSSLLYSIHAGTTSKQPLQQEVQSTSASGFHPESQASFMEKDALIEFNVTNMSLSVAYLHEIHRQRLLRSRQSQLFSPSTGWTSGPVSMAQIPEETTGEDLDSKPHLLHPLELSDAQEYKGIVK